MFAQLPRAGKRPMGKTLGPCPGSNSLLWEEAKAGWGHPSKYSAQGEVIVFIYVRIGKARPGGWQKMERENMNILLELLGGGELLAQ